MPYRGVAWYGKLKILRFLRREGWEIRVEREGNLQQQQRSYAVEDISTVIMVSGRFLVHRKKAGKDGLWEKLGRCILGQAAAYR